MAFGGGGSTPFGGGQSAPLFGGSSVQPLFGASSPPAAQQRPAFGMGPTPAFGAAAAAPSAFGAAPGAAPSAFGAPAQPTSSLFGAPAQGAFGQPAAAPTMGSFGQPAAAPGGVFGQSAGGSTAFGQPAAGPSGSLFGSTTTGGGLFGNTAASAPAFGASSTPAFGAPATPFGQPQQSAFGAASSSAFGASSGGGLFGGSTSGGGLFGSARPAGTGAFGAAPAAQPATGFGQQPSAFGQPSTGGLFGASGMGGAAQPGAPGRGTAGVTWSLIQESEGNAQPASNYQTITMMPIFKSRCLEELRLEDYVAGNRPGAAGGAPGQGTAAFGAQPQQQTGFGGSAFGQSTPAFGAPAAGAGGGAFGAFGGAAAAGQSSSSLFGSKPAQPSGGGLFGSTPSGGGLFGSTPAATPFGQAAPSAPSLFGGAAATGASQSSLFGSTTPSLSQPSTFGQSQGSLFGAAQPQQAQQAQPQQPSLFGSAPAQTPLFGASQPSLFGATGASSVPSLGLSGSSLFGGTAAPSQPSLFGTQTAGSASSGGTGLFGSSGFNSTGSSGGGLFGAQPQTGIASTPGLSLNLGSGTSTGGGLFGASAATSSGGLGLGAGLTRQTGGSNLFGAPPGGLFGGMGSGLGTGASSTPGLGSGGLFSGGNTFQQQQQQQQGAQLPQSQAGALTASIDQNPFGTSAWFSAALSSLNAAGTSQGGSAAGKLGSSLQGSPAARRQADARRPPRSAARLRTRTRTSALRGRGEYSMFENSLSGSAKFASAIDLGTPSNRPRFGELTGFQNPSYPGSSSGAPVERSSRASTLKKLVIRPRQTSVASPDTGGAPNSSRPVGLSPFLHAAASPVAVSGGNLNSSRRELVFDTPVASSAARSRPFGKEEESEVGMPDSSPDPSNGFGTHSEADTPRVPPLGGPGSYPALLRKELASAKSQSRSVTDERDPADEDTSAGGDQYDAADVESVPEDDDSENALKEDLKSDDVYGANKSTGAGKLRACPVSTRTDMFTRPSMEELENMTEDELAKVEDFAVGVEGVGLVEWPGISDVRYLNLDLDISIKSREVVVYPDDANRPEVGVGLNKRARVSLYGLWKRDKSTKLPIKNASGAAAMVKKLKSHCDREDLIFLGYDVSSGTWTFETPHF